MKRFHINKITSAVMTGEINISLMEVMGGHFIGNDPPDEWADLFVVCCVLLRVRCVDVVWSDSPTQFA